MKKFLKLLLAGLVLVGCSTQAPQQPEKTTTYHVLCPTGAPTLAFLSVYEEIAADGQFDVTEGTDQLVAELSKTDSVYDVIVAPVNLGAQLIAGQKTEYRLDGIITWGNLYIVGTENALSEEGNILLFGEGAVPGKIYEASQVETTLTPSYLGSVQDVQAALLSGQAKVGLLAEPVATATIAKAGQQNLELKVLLDMQEAYAKAKGTEDYGYPQAAIFVKKGSDISDLTGKISAFTEDKSKAEEYLNTIGTDTLGLPDAKIVVKSLEGQNVHYRKAADVSDQLTEFLALFNIEYSEDFLND